MIFATDDACVDYRDQPYCETKHMWVLLKIRNDPLNKKHIIIMNKNYCLVYQFILMISDYIY